MKVIVAGSRTFVDYNLLKDTLDKLEITEIVSGTASGADKLGERYAEENDIPVTRFPANWSEHGKAAGPIRNNQMAKYGDFLVLFWNGESRGSFNMMKEAERAGIEMIIKFL